MAFVATLALFIIYACFNRQARVVLVYQTSKFVMWHTASKLGQAALVISHNSRYALSIPGGHVMRLVLPAKYEGHRGF
jgi:hypothetical protein